MMSLEQKISLCYLFIACRIQEKNNLNDWNQFLKQLKDMQKESIILDTDISIYEDFRIFLADHIQIVEDKILYYGN